MIGQVSLQLRSVTIGISALLWVCTLAHAESVSIPVDPRYSEPANDLIYEGEEIDRGRAAELGVDLSTLEPAATDVWQNTSYPVNDEQDIPFPAADAEFVYDSDPGSTGGLLRARVLNFPNLVAAPNAFQLVLSMNLHPALARAALLRKLGYPIPSPRHYKTLRLRFVDIPARTLFMDRISDLTATDRKRWIVQMPDNDPFVVLKDVALERAQIDIPMYHWGIIKADHLRGRRSVRSLLVPLAFLEIPESVNIFSWEAGNIMNESVVLYHPFAASFLEASYDDLKWMVRRIGRLNDTELKSIAQAGRFPDDVAELVYQKLLSRRNHLIEIFRIKEKELHGAPRKFKVENRLNYGNVKKGHLTVADYPDYPMSFAFKMPESPLRGSQVWRYLSIDMIGNAIGGLLDQMNGRALTFGSPQTVLIKHQDELIKKLQEHQQQNPGQPYQQKVSAWAGPVGGFGVTVSRDVVTGTYYGNESKVQLVDSVGVRASIGLFMGLDGIARRAGGIIPNASGNVAVLRNYVHVRPIADMRDALRTNWTDMFVAGFMGKLAGILKHGPEATPEDLTKQLKKFFLELSPNEMFMVSDTLVVGTSVGASVPLPILMGPGMRLYNPTISARVSSQPQLLRRTTFIRTETGVQVYLQDAKIANLDLEMGANWLLNILTVGMNKKVGDADSEAYLLDTSKIIESNKPEEIRALTVGLRSLLRFQQPAPLREKFPHYGLDHDMDARVRRARILPFVFRNLKEEHRVTISPQGHELGETGPTGENYDRTLFSQKVVETRGFDGWSMVADIGRVLGNLLPGLAQSGEASTKFAGQAISTIFGGLAGNTGPNPANSFLGKGYWSVYKSEAEVTPSRRSRPVTSVEHNWGGWLLKRKKLLKILNRIEDEVASLGLERRISRNEAFSQTKQLQLYQIGSTFRIYQPGVQKIIDDLLKPATVHVAIDNLIKVEGIPNLVEYCRTARPTGRRCLKPWMEDALEVRKDLIGEALPETAEDEVRFANRLMKKMEKKVDLGMLMKWLGSDKFFFQVRVSGFRTKDENGDREYVSDTIGTQNSIADLGAFPEFISETGISANEVYGGYLSEGY